VQPRRLAGFWALIAVQFQGAFSDNALKWLVSFPVLDSALSKERRDLWFVLVANLLSFVGVALPPLAQYAMLRLGHPDPSRVFLIAAAMTLLIGILLVRMLPDLWPRALDRPRGRPRGPRAID
jgi:hypothetical protein